MANDDTVDLDLMETAPGFDPDQPARPYFTMGGIVQRMLASSAFANHPVRALIGEELLLAIFWEETGFRNRRQQGDATFKASHQTWATRDASKTVGGFVAAGNHAVGFG